MAFKKHDSVKYILSIWQVAKEPNLPKSKEIDSEKVAISINLYMHSEM
jgi:hypothetical protein